MTASSSIPAFRDVSRPPDKASGSSYGAVGKSRSDCQQEQGFGGASIWETLTPRERDIARLVAEGLTNGEIAKRLVLSRRTVESHLYRIFVKLGLSSRVQLAVRAASEVK